MESTPMGEIGPINIFKTKKTLQSNNRMPADKIIKGDVGGLFRTILQIALGFYILYDGYKFYSGDKEKVSTLWYGIACLIYFLSILSIYLTNTPWI